MKLPFVFIVSGFLFIAFGVWSLWAGKTIGLYGVIETRSSPFYWIIVIVCIALGVMNVIAGLHMFFR